MLSSSQHVVAGRLQGERRHPRYPTERHAKLTTDHLPLLCLVHDVSLGGAGLRVSQPIEDGAVVLLDIHEIGTLRAEVVWTDGCSVGVRFLENPAKVARLFGRELDDVPPLAH